MYKSSLLKSIPHGFFTRRGGVSEGVYDSLSFVVNKNDLEENVRKNRSIALETLGTPSKALVTMNQIHSKRVLVVQEPWHFGEGKTPEADALVTQNPDVVLGVFTADCVPILLYNEPAQTIAAIHSGWRGAQQGIVAECIRTMSELGADPAKTKAVIGPCISQDNYEVGPEVQQEFMISHQDANIRFKPSKNPGKYMFDLPGLVVDQLLKCGVGEVEEMNLDTYSLEDHFFSCRRAYHRGEDGFGCMLSAISL